jgi:hypothetical protein
MFGKRLHDLKLNSTTLDLDPISEKSEEHSKKSIFVDSIEVQEND